MSTNRVRLRQRVQEMLRDFNPSTPLGSDYFYNEVIERNMYLIAGRVTMTPGSVTTITLVAGTAQYTLTDVEIQSVLLVQLDSTGQELTFLPWAEFNATYSQDSSDPVPNGTPRHYTFRDITQSATHDTAVRFGPTPDAADAADLYLAELPSAATTPIAPYLSLAETSTIPFPNDLMRSLQCACAGEIATTLSDELLAAHGLSDRAAQLWLSQVPAGIRSYNQRMRQREMIGHAMRRTRDRALVARR